MSNSKILIADDNVLIVDMIKEALIEEEYDVVIASDGEEAMDKVCKEMPALIILDIEMPKINGYSVCKMLKEDSKTRNIPIIMISTKDKMSDKMWGMSIGADEYLPKPFEIYQLMTLVKDKLKEFIVE